jgi:lipopolysaccharide biosynthesis regulator YciM
VLIVCAGLIATALAAQIQPVPEQQLANGFLGDRNARMTEHDLAPNETYAAARKNLTTAIRKNKNFIGAHLALGLLEAEHGDKTAAIGILNGLKARQADCAGRCRDSAALDIAVNSIGAALKARPD